MYLTRQRALICVALMAALLAGVGTASAAEKRDGVFIHISQGTAEPHRVLMALNMANMWSEDHPVLVYFDIKGIEVVLKDSKDITFAHFPSSKTALANLLKKGVVIMACPGCLKAAGKTPADLAPGIKVADKKQFFGFTEGRIITLDY